MNKKEVAELKRRLKKDKATFTQIAGCYVDGNHEKVCKFRRKFLTLEEDEYYKYLDIANKVLSGTLGNNLLDLEFPVKEERAGGCQQVLMALRDCRLEDDNLLEAYYDHVIDTYSHVGNYLILMFYDNYDVMVKTKDNLNLDESEEVFSYILTAICPVELAKPGLGYLEKEKRIGPRVRDWIVGVPDTGFLFPAFNDRSTDIHSCLFYTKNTKEPHSEFMEKGLGCDAVRTASEQKTAFHDIIRTVIGSTNREDEAEDVLLDVQSNLNGRTQEYRELYGDEAQPLLLDTVMVEQALTDSHITPENVGLIQKAVDDAFGSRLPEVNNVIDSRSVAANEIRTEKKALEKEIAVLHKQLSDMQEKTDRDEKAAGSGVELKVCPQMEPFVEIQQIDGKKYLVLPVEDTPVFVNGKIIEKQ